MVRIAIDGNIGSGKSTLINQLKKNGYDVYHEDVTKWTDEGWLHNFYTDPKKYSLGFQLRILLSQSEKMILNNKNLIIHERSPFTLNNIFGKILLEDNNLSNLELELCYKFAEKFGWQPDYIIYLECNPNECYNRIISRDRSDETIKLDYLQKLHDKHEHEFKRSSIPVYRIDASQKESYIYENCIKILKSIQ